MREMDRITIEEFGIPGQVLMENAGRGATQFFLQQFGAMSAATVGILAGRGNNGGDGFVMARYLRQLGIDVRVYLLSERHRIRGDAAANLNLLDPLGIPVVALPDPETFASRHVAMKHHGIWIDAILGTGLESDVRDYFHQVIEFVNARNRPVFSVDIPSGLNSETGQPCGTCIQAAATATFAFAKIGHLIYPGAKLTGNLAVVDIGIPPMVRDRIAPRQEALTPALIQSYFSPRPPDAHKGHTGHLLVAAGSPGKTGAAAMTATSAVRAGAGLVTLAVAKSLNVTLENQVTEAMTWPLQESGDGRLGLSAVDDLLALLSGKKALAIGPGIGTAPDTRSLVHRLVRESPVPVVIDADGLNCLAGNSDVLRRAIAPLVLTPHPGEMARLTGLTTDVIQSDRIQSARRLARDVNAHIVLKGARTVIAHPDGTAAVNPTGNPGMATGGMGDVLTGLIGGFLVQGLSPKAAARAGAYLHGLAADHLAAAIGPIGYTATDVMQALPSVMAELIARKPPHIDSWPVYGIAGTVDEGVACPDNIPIVLQR
jgi:NAD(P)H-hydrate epimerase